VNVTDLVGRLEKAKPNGKGWMACCPAHDDSTPSLSVSEGDDGRVILKCFAGCPTEAVAGAIGLEMSDLFADDPLRFSRRRESSTGLTLAQLAADKKLEPEFLRECGLEDGADKYGKNAVLIRYRNRDGQTVAKKERGGTKQFWRKGSSNVIYTKDGTTPYDAGVDFTVTLAASGQTVWTETNVDATKTVAPRQAIHDTAGVASLYAAGGEPVEDYIYADFDRVQIVVASGGNAKVGSFQVVIA